MAIVSQQLASMKSSKKRKAERQMSRSNSSKMTKPAVGTKEKSSSKYSRPSKSSGEKRKRPVKSKSEDDLLPEFTFEQKKDLSESINNLDGNQLNTVVQIIQSSMPNLDGVCFRNSSHTLKWLLCSDSFFFLIYSKDKKKLSLILILWIEERFTGCMSLLLATALFNLHNERSKRQRSRACNIQRRMPIARY